MQECKKGQIIKSAPFCLALANPGKSFFSDLQLLETAEKSAEIQAAEKSGDHAEKCAEDV